MLASEQFGKLARAMLRSHTSPEALAVIIPGNPAYAEPAELEAISDRALEEVTERLKAYPD